MAAHRPISKAKVQLGLLTALTAGGCVAPPMPPRPPEFRHEENKEGELNRQCLDALTAAFQNAIDAKKPDEVLRIFRDIAFNGLYITCDHCSKDSNVDTDSSKLLQLKLSAQYDKPNDQEQKLVFEVDLTDTVKRWKHLERHGYRLPTNSDLKDAVLRVLHDTINQSRFKGYKIAGFSIANAYDNQFFGTVIRDRIIDNIGYIAEHAQQVLGDFGRYYDHDVGMDRNWFQEEEAAREKRYGELLTERLKEGQRKYRDAASKPQSPAQGR